MTQEERDAYLMALGPALEAAIDPRRLAWGRETPDADHLRR
jgi:hypothetical protein